MAVILKETSPDCRRESELSQSSDHAALQTLATENKHGTTQVLKQATVSFDMTLVVNLIMMIDDSCPAGPLRGTLYLDAM